jgi:hypothetical protein
MPAQIKPIVQSERMAMRNVAQFFLMAAVVKSVIDAGMGGSVPASSKY